MIWLILFQIFTIISGILIYFGWQIINDDPYGSDRGTMQILFGFVLFVAISICSLVGAGKIQNEQDIKINHLTELVETFHMDEIGTL